MGGEYGDVRANIDIEKLTDYLVQNLSIVCAPIVIKQFKASTSWSTWASEPLTILHPVRPGTSAVRVYDADLVKNDLGSQTPHTL